MASILPRGIHILRGFSSLTQRLFSVPTPRRSTSSQPSIDRERECARAVIEKVNNIIGRKEEGRLFAVVQVCGKQFKVTNNDIIVVDGHWPPQIGDGIRLEKVLLAGGADFTLVGRPILPLNQVSVKATVIEKSLTHTKVTFRYIKRKQYKNINFLRNPLTYLRINSIELMGKVNELGDIDGNEGTPGTGKSRLAEAVATRCNLRWIDVSAEAVRRDCCPEFDEVLQCAVLDEDRLVTALEPDMAPGGVILDYHGCDFFPERWIDGVFVLRADNTILYDRLAARGYSSSKIQENVTAEIFQTILDEAKDSYREEIVQELRSDDEGQFEANQHTIVDWVTAWNSKSTLSPSS